MSRLKKLDEYELIKRGNVFKHCLFVMGVLLVLKSLLEFLGILHLGYLGDLIVVVIIVAQLSIEMICHGIFPMTEKRQKYMIYVVGVYGLCLLGYSLYSLLDIGSVWTSDGNLSEPAAGMVFGFLLLTIMAAYLIRRMVVRKVSEES